MEWMSIIKARALWLICDNVTLLISLIKCHLWEKRPVTLKYTGIYPLLPEPVQEFFSTCDYKTKKEVLKVYLARLTEESSFKQTTGALVTALEHGVSDADTSKPYSVG